MFLRFRTGIAAAAVLATPVVALAVMAPADAAGTYYSNCDAVHRDYTYGVAKSDRAAAKQVRDGYGRPSTTRRAKAVYAENHSSLDRDNDGTACEA